MIDCGRFNRRVKVMKWGDAENELGQSIEKLINFKSIWAEIHPLKGKEMLEADLIESRERYKITCRYFQGLTEDMVIVYQEKEFSITSICDVDYKHRYYEIMCQERVGKKLKREG